MLSSKYQSNLMISFDTDSETDMLFTKQRPLLTSALLASNRYLCTMI